LPCNHQLRAPAHAHPCLPIRCCHYAHGQSPTTAGRNRGTDCNHCNGEIVQGSSTKTPYMVCPFPQTPYFAHTMQHPGEKRVVREEGRENRGERDKSSAARPGRQRDLLDLSTSGHHAGLRRSGLISPILLDCPLRLTRHGPRKAKHSKEPSMKPHAKHSTSLQMNPLTVVTTYFPAIPLFSSTLIVPLSQLKPPPLQDTAKSGNPSSFRSAAASLPLSTPTAYSCGRYRVPSPFPKKTRIADVHGLVTTTS